MNGPGYGLNNSEIVDWSPVEAIVLFKVYRLLFPREWSSGNSKLTDRILAQRLGVSKGILSLPSIPLQRAKGKFKLYVGNNSNHNYVVGIEFKIMTANRAYLAHIKTYRCKVLSRNTKFKLYKTLIRPLLAYGSENWAMTAKEINALTIF